MLALALAGLIGFTLKDGRRGALGFTIGALASALSFWLLERLTTRLTTGRSILLGLRFLLIGGGLYAILRFNEVNTSAVAAGLLISVTAVTLANLYDWFRS